LHISFSLLLHGFFEGVYHISLLYESEIVLTALRIDDGKGRVHIQTIDSDMDGIY